MADIGKEPRFRLIQILEFAVVFRQSFLLGDHFFPQTKLREAELVVEVEANADECRSHKKEKQGDRYILNASCGIEGYRKVANYAECRADHPIDTSPPQEQHRSNHDEVQTRIVWRAPSSGFRKHPMDGHHWD